MGLRNLLRLLPIERFRNPPPVVAVLRLSGVIGMRGRRGLSLAGKASAIERAFKLSGLAAVALSINSPGGSPVQSALIFRRIRQLAEENNVPVFAFAEDVAASGGYWLALAGDEIYAEDTSILGSIGVVSGGFGFSELMRRIGISRRLYTAGERKAMLDPFLAEDPEGIARLEALQRDIHGSFKDIVRLRRGAKLKGDDETLFNGDIFTGRGALANGLIDGIGELRGILRARFGDKVQLRIVDPEKRRFSLGLPRLVSARGESGTAAGEMFGDLVASVEERLIWSRFGL
ncbi:MAG TPA: S49 family peptidase [Stellaceae bacterium]|jgi:signal peptide peptidase SppA|nr:S49 family peptidase [Stellaceae bacterium]